MSNWSPELDKPVVSARKVFKFLISTFHHFLWRFEILNFKTKKWVSMFLSYLVKNFFLVILRPRTFFELQNFSKKNRFFGQFFEILQVVRNPVLAKPYEELEGWFSGQRKLSVFRLPVFFDLGSATNIWPQITRQSSISSSWY